MAFNLLKIEFIAIILACFVVHFSAAFHWQGENVRWASNCDFVGNDIVKNMPVPGEKCGNHCENNPSCSHFSWSPLQSGTCVLKSSRPTLSNSSEYESLAVATQPGSACGFLHFSWKEGQNWAFNCDFVHSINLTAAVSKGEECGGLCAKSSECTHFTHTVRQGSDGICQLKSGQVSKRDAKYSPHNVCGIIDKNSQPVTSATRPTTPSALLTTAKSNNETKQSVSSATTTCALLITVLFLSLWH